MDEISNTEEKHLAIKKFISKFRPLTNLMVGSRPRYSDYDEDASPRPSRRVPGLWDYSGLYRGRPLLPYTSIHLYFSKNLSEHIDLVKELVKAVCEAACHHRATNIHIAAYDEQTVTRTIKPLRETKFTDNIGRVIDHLLGRVHSTEALPEMEIVAASSAMKSDHNAIALIVEKSSDSSRIPETIVKSAKGVKLGVIAFIDDEKSWMLIRQYAEFLKRK